jgi:hypothetical protein
MPTINTPLLSRTACLGVVKTQKVLRLQYETWILGYGNHFIAIIYVNLRLNETVVFKITPH